MKMKITRLKMRMIKMNMRMKMREQSCKDGDEVEDGYQNGDEERMGMRI